MTYKECKQCGGYWTESGENRDDCPYCLSKDWNKPKEKKMYSKTQKILIKTFTYFCVTGATVGMGMIIYDDMRLTMTSRLLWLHIVLNLVAIGLYLGMLYVSHKLLKRPELLIKPTNDIVDK